MTERALIFECEANRLVGILHVPGAVSERRLGVVVVVGGPQYRVGSHRQFTLMARAFCAAGYPVLRFDYRGMGDSDGETRTFESVDADIRAAVDTLIASCPGLEGVILWGLCDAASACSMYLNRGDRRVQGLVLANPWVRTVAGEARAYIKHYYLQRLLQKSFWSKLLHGTFNPARALRELAGMYGRTRSDGGQGTGGQRPGGFVERMRAGLAKFPAPVLLLLSEVDLTAKEFQDHCGSRSEWQALLGASRIRTERLPGVDHTFSTENSLPDVARRCLDWMGGLSRARAGGNA